MEFSSKQEDSTLCRHSFSLFEKIRNASAEWIIQAFPKYPYYSYGKQIFYVDKDGYNAYFKVVYDRAGGQQQKGYRDHVPLSELGPEYFTESNLRQLSK